MMSMIGDTSEVQAEDERSGTCRSQIGLTDTMRGEAAGSRRCRQTRGDLVRNNEPEAADSGRGARSARASMRGR
jgi:hypothetical protein